MNSIGSYKFVRFISSGSYGGVWECKHVPTGEPYACKVIDLELIQDEDFLTHFKNELFIHSQISHPAITKLKDVLMDNENIYIIIELCDGGDLNDAVQKSDGLDENKARKYFAAIMGAISYIHKLGVAHRDIKLENILINHNDMPQLTDFGLCKKQNGDNLLLTTCGTLVYAAPEIIREEPYNGMKADIWSAGVLLYAMVADHFPWMTEEDLPPQKLVQATTQQIINGDIPYPETMSFELINLLQNMLNIDPDERPTADEVLQHPWLEVEYQETDGSSTDPDPALVSSVKSLLAELDKKAAAMKAAK